MLVYMTSFYCVPGTVLGKRVGGKSTLATPWSIGYRASRYPNNVSSNVSVIPCQADRQAQKTGHD